MFNNIDFWSCCISIFNKGYFTCLSFFMPDLLGLSIKNEENL